MRNNNTFSFNFCIEFWSELGTHHISCEVSWLLVLLIPILMFIIMFTFVVFSHQLTLPFPSSWNIDVNLYK